VALERRVAAGDVDRYGVASREAFRVPSDHDAYLSLPGVVSRARAAADAVGRETTGLRAIQLPSTFTWPTRSPSTPTPRPTGERRARSGSSGRPACRRSPAPAWDRANWPGRAVPAAVDARLAGDAPAQRAINFARSAPGVTAALVGTTDVSPLDENVAAGTFEPTGAAAFDATFE